MRILLIAGCLEPSKDGVGDYTRSLASGCERLGHKTYLLSLNDPWSVGMDEQGQTLRLGSNLSWAERTRAAKIFRINSKADIVSLQFVPYSFDARGLKWNLARILSEIIGRTAVQIMFHEIWLGENLSAGIKERFVGFLQRVLIHLALGGINIRAIHTSNFAYREILRRNGIEAEHLPLFGSVPVDRDGNGTDETKHFRSGDILRLGMFGSIHPEWSGDELIDKLLELRGPIRLSHIGGIGPGESVWNDLVSRFESKLEFSRLGLGSVTEIAGLFASIHIGIATTPMSIIGKSASVAAMLEHGLPVIVTRDDIQFRSLGEISEIDPLIIPFNGSFLERVKTVKRRQPESWLPKVTEQFLRDVEYGLRGG